MEEKLLCFIRKRFLPGDIYLSRKSSWRSIIGQMLMVGSILACPITYHLIQTEEVLEQGSIVFLIYGALILLNGLFVVFLALFSLMLNLSAAECLSFKEFCGLYLYAATFPVTMVCLVGMLLGIVFIYPLYNMGLIIYTYIIYQKGQKKERLKV